MNLYTVHHTAQQLCALQGSNMTKAKHWIVAYTLYMQISTTCVMRTKTAFYFGRRIVIAKVSNDDLVSLGLKIAMFYVLKCPIVAAIITSYHNQTDFNLLLSINKDYFKHFLPKLYYISRILCPQTFTTQLPFLGINCSITNYLSVEMNYCVSFSDLVYLFVIY